jgi:hypothetical protein
MQHIINVYLKVCLPLDIWPVLPRLGLSPSLTRLGLYPPKRSDLSPLIDCRTLTILSLTCPSQMALSLSMAMHIAFESDD